MSFRPSRSASLPPLRADCTVPMRDQLRAAVPRVIPGHGVDLSTLERFVLTKVDGRRTVTDVAGIVEIAVDEALAIVMSLVERRALRIEGAKAPPRRPSSGFRPRQTAEEAPITLQDDDFEEVFDDMLLSDDPAHADVFTTPTVAGSMRALTADEARRALDDERLPPAGGARRS